MDPIEPIMISSPAAGPVGQPWLPGCVESWGNPPHAGTYFAKNNNVVPTPFYQSGGRKKRCMSRRSHCNKKSRRRKSTRRRSSRRKNTQCRYSKRHRSRRR